MRKKFVFLVAVILASHMTIFAADTSSTYDGNWWRSSSKDQRTGFIAGYIDCAIYEGGKKQLASVSWNVLEPKVTQYYETHASETRTPVATLIVNLGLKERPPKGGDHAEKWPEKHGIFDGEYWRQSLAGHRGGFVMGFLACYRSLPKKTASFSRSDASYVPEISKWYGVKENDPSEINEKRVNTKIADVLFRFKDTAG